MTARLSPAELGRLLHWMPIIIRAEGLTEWERKFCASMVARSRRGRFQPSAKQAAVMARLVREFQESVVVDDAKSGGMVE